MVFRRRSLRPALLAVFSTPIALGIALASARAGAAEPGFEFSLRAGFSLPLGDLTGAAPDGSAGLSYRDAFAGLVPLGLSAGVRVLPGVSVAASAEYDSGLARTQSRACTAGTTCGGHRLHGGLDLAWLLRPAAALSPWLGLGFGYEALSQSQAAGSLEATSTFSGFDAAVRAGLDFRVAPGLRLGPALELSVGRFTSASASEAGSEVSVPAPRANHALLTLGARATWEL